MSTHLVQLTHPEQGRAVALVEGELLRLLTRHETTYALARAAIHDGRRLAEVVRADLGNAVLDYPAVYEGRSDWQLLPPLDHPDEPARCLITGTGLTHKASAQARQAMHELPDEQLTDSMRMYQWGVEGGRPKPGAVGTPPEWFYKGCGTILRAHEQALAVPSFAGDGGEEPEVCGLYVIAPDGRPRRVGMAIGNEFSDHVTERKNYLYLAPSKLRQCAVGPELVAGADFAAVAGTVRIERAGQTLWEKAIGSGEANMCHTLANLEHHHFKYPEHRRPGDVHIHFLGADAFSFGAGVVLQDGDVMEVAWAGFGKPLRNPVRVERPAESLVTAEGL